MSTKPLAGLRVLILDDHPDSLEAMCFLLQCSGADVRGTPTVREALATLGEFQPHAVLSDLMMPGEDGYVFIKRVRALPPDQGGLTPAVAYSALAESATHAVQAGYQRYIRKPASADLLVDALASVAQERQRLADAIGAETKA